MVNVVLRPFHSEGFAGRYPALWLGGMALAPGLADDKQPSGAALACYEKALPWIYPLVEWGYDHLSAIFSDFTTAHPLKITTCFGYRRRFSAHL